MSKLILPLALALIALFGCTGTTEQSTCDQFPEAKECLTPQQVSRDSLDSIVVWMDSLTGDFEAITVQKLRLDSNIRGHLNVKFDTLREEQVAILELQDSMSCGVQFDNDFSASVDALGFLIDGTPHALIGYDTYGTYKEYLPCGIHSFRWELKKNKADGLTNITLGNIISLDSAEYSYKGDWSFENGWPMDLTAKGWVVSNLSANQGVFGLWPGFLNDEEVRDLIIPISKGSTKLNFFYEYSDAASSVASVPDTSILWLGDDLVALNACCWSWFSNSTKYSVILDGTDTSATIHFRKSEDGYSKFMIDDIRLLSTTPIAQTDGVWDFEDSFYPTEISHGWVIDNQTAYEGEYSIHAPKKAAGICGFDLQTGTSTNMSLWTKCTSRVDTKIRILNADTTQSCNCRSYWTECNAKLNGKSPVHIETDCAPGPTEDRRIDLIKAW